jgi:hypothetical protein
MVSQVSLQIINSTFFNQIFAFEQPRRRRSAEPSSLVKATRLERGLAFCLVGPAEPSSLVKATRLEYNVPVQTHVMFGHLWRRDVAKKMQCTLAMLRKGEIALNSKPLPLSVMITSSSW